MMEKILTTAQIREADQYTIHHEPVSSIDLMERASGKLFDWITTNVSLQLPVFIFAGPGNNGGDGLALARMLAGKGIEPKVFLLDTGSELAPDAAVNYRRLAQSGIQIFLISHVSDFPDLSNPVLIVDALFGSGLKRPLQGLASKLVRHLNGSGHRIISVDMPSGLFGEDNRHNDWEAIIRAETTLSFQSPKLSFFFSENHPFTGEWHILPIGLHDEFVSRVKTDFYYLTKAGVKSLLRSRSRFDHKGNFGHALLLAGSFGKLGAAILSGKACLRAGCGLLTVHLPGCGYKVMQTALPEAMCSVDVDDTHLTNLPELSGHQGIAVGPGIGLDNRTGNLLEQLVGHAGKPLVLDADAINLVSEKRNLISSIPENSILTPHPGEFERLAGKCSSGYERFLKQRDFSIENKLIVILKGAFTSVSLPDGRTFFNTTGNPGMATAGSGDVLTGIVLSLLTQAYTPEEAAILAVFIHGLSGDIALQKQSPESLLASDIIEQLGSAFKQLRD